jgi:hypothetical protein
MKLSGVLAEIKVTSKTVGADIAAYLVQRLT